MKISFFICVLLGLSLTHSVCAQAKYKIASVCEILADVQTHRLRYVAIDADLFIVRPDGMALFDKRCMKKGLGLNFPTQDVDESVSNLEKAIRNGKWPMESTGRFCGRIIRNAKSQRPILSLRSIQNLQPKGGETSPPDVINPIRMGEPTPGIPHTVPPVQP